ncbi:Hpt domain-containing protein [Oceanisphaera ostreae]|uniref:Hpt domain-containing protein n=1 Tax=Oceanisphaera ostreae TaxID=914151 RepID=A0ABW3KF02_9GAMM
MIDWQTLQEKLPLLDEYHLQRMEQELGPSVFARLLRLFIEDGQQLGKTLELAFLDHSWAQMALSCHSLKSACGSYGALRCQYLSEKLEQSCNQQDEVTIGQQYKAWQSALAATLVAAQDRLK